MPIPTSPSVLFGHSRFLTRRKYMKIPEDDSNVDFTYMEENHDPLKQNSSFSKRASQSYNSAMKYLFEFMFEDEEKLPPGQRSSNSEEDQFEDEPTSTTLDSDNSPSIWNPLNLSLCGSLALSASATAVPISLVTAMADTWPHLDADFVTKAVSSAVWGTAVGKFVNGLLTDMIGARLVALFYQILLACALISLSFSMTPNQAIWACFWTEFCSTVQFPSVIVTLSAHYEGHGSLYDKGIFLASLSSHIGSLIGIVGSSLLLQHGLHWRFIAVIGAWQALQASAVNYLYNWDAPNERNKARNPVDLDHWRRYHQSLKQDREKHSSELRFPKSVRWIIFIIFTVVGPSMKHVLGSGIFWAVAFAHAGGSMAKSSVRIVGAYLADTNNFKDDGQLTQTETSGLAVYVALGTVAGLVIAGHYFANQVEHPRNRKWLVSKLYMIMIGSCYSLAILAIPGVAVALDDSLMTVQMVVLVILGFGISVPYYHLPSLVSSHFPHHKALFLSLTDCIAFGVAGWLWRVVGHIVAACDEGWAYGWACVALLIILSGVLMVEFLEHFYCGPVASATGVYETVFA